MDLRTYQRWTNSTVVYGPEAEGKYVAFGLAAEVGELMSALAKYHRGDYSYEEYAERAKQEIGDIMWFLARFSDYSGWDLTDLLDANVDKLEERKANGKIRGDGDTR